MLNWLKTQKKWLIPTGLAAVLVFLLFAITLHLQHKRQEKSNAAATDPTAAKEVSQGQPIVQGTPAATADHEKPPDFPPRMIPEDRMSGFSKEPSPAEVVRKLEEMDAYNRKEEERKLANLQVVWPLYLFSTTKRTQDMVRVLLDASENGFGVIIVTEVSLNKFPGIATAQPGDRVWLAGRIANVDTQGTGQITLITEYAAFSDETPHR